MTYECCRYGAAVLIDPAYPFIVKDKVASGVDWRSEKPQARKWKPRQNKRSPAPLYIKKISMDDIKNLLYQVATISTKNAEILDASGGRFNMFRTCGVNCRENTHSAIIAEFLNPLGSHGLKSKLLECFIEVLKELEDKRYTLGVFNCDCACVHTEYATNEGRMDILIEDNQNKAIIIENKFDAPDQSKQLKRYDTYAKKYKEHQVLYLTLDGKEASINSGEGVTYLPVSHGETIIAWMEKCVSIASRFPIVRETIIQYINHLKQLTNQDMDTRNKEELVKMLTSDPKLLESANEILEIWDDCKREMVSVLARTIEMAAERLGLKNKKDPNFGNKDTGIALFKEGWDFCILYCFWDSYNLYLGLDHLDNEKKCSEEKVESLRNVCGEFEGYEFKYKKSWIVVSIFNEWNRARLSDWAGSKGQEKLSELIYKKTKEIFDALPINPQSD